MYWCYDNSLSYIERIILTLYGLVITSLLAYKSLAKYSGRQTSICITIGFSQS